MSYNFKKVKILIVDDMKQMLDLTKSVLNIFGFQNVFTAQDTDTAYELVCKKDPDLIIADWLMEPMDGLEFTEKIRKNPMAPNPYVPVLMMTGFSSRIRVEHARDIGITEFLVKPFAANDLYTRITQIIEKPRQFVDSGTFFGPDRRRKSSDGYEGLRRRDAEEETRENLSTDKQEKANAILKKLREDTKKIS